jgi:histidine triad (HIT) family protein
MTEEQRKELEEKIKNMSPEELKEFQKQQCIFCQIIDGKVPSKKVYEDDKCLAVMDIGPAAIGHVLLLPKEHYSIMPQVPEEEIGHMFMVAKHLSQAMLKKLKVGGTNIFVANGQIAGQRAQHFMIHIIPRREGDSILEIPENLVEEEMREKLGTVVRNKMNELLGIKDSGKKEEKEVVEEGNVVEAEFEEEKEEGEVKEEKEEEEKGEGEEESEKKEEPKEEKREEEEPEEKKEEGEEEESGEKETDLDDIAKLFK